MADKRPLSHQQVERLLSVSRELSDEKMTAVADHLAVCHACARLAKETRQVDGLLKNLTWKMPDPNLAANFYETIEKEGRSWSQTAMQFGGQFAGAAVLVLVVLSAWLVLRNRPIQGPIEPATVPVEETAEVTVKQDPETSLLPKYTLTETVTLFAFSPESSYLATAEENRIRLWEGASGKELFTLKAETDDFESLAFTPNGVNLLARDVEGRFHRWLAFNGAYQRTFSGAQSAIGSPFALGNTTLAVVTAENHIALWPLIGSQPRATLKSDGQPILSLAISADGQTTAAVLQDGTISLWNQYGDPAGTLSPNQGTAKGLIISKDGRLVAAYSENNIQLWRENVLRFQLPPDNGALPGAITDMLLVSDGNYLMVAYEEGVIQSWDVVSGELVKTFGAGAAIQGAIGLMRNGFLYATLNSQGEFTVWEKPE